MILRTESLARAKTNTLVATGKSGENFMATQRMVQKSRRLDPRTKSVEEKAEINDQLKQNQERKVIERLGYSPWV